MVSEAAVNAAESEDVLLPLATLTTPGVGGAPFFRVYRIRWAMLQQGLHQRHQGKSQAELRRIVRHERMVELAMEGLRFFDLRRWKIAADVMQGPVPGLRCIQSGETEVRTLNYGGVVRSFDPNRDYLWPIPQQETVLNPNLVQNRGH